MTSISPAQPRPPLSINLSPTLPRSHTRTRSYPQGQVKDEGIAVQGENATDAVDERPAKRRKTSSGSRVVSVKDSPLQAAPTHTRYRSAPWSAVILSAAEKVSGPNAEAPPPPLPEKPWGATIAKENSLHDTRPSVRVRKNVAVPNTPDCIQTPSGAPHFEKGKRADYFPWSGKHPEDVLNEAHVKQGYFDRPPHPPEKELSTAKPPLYNALKHKSGLECLSALFSLVLESKSKHGAFSSNSSFKGPPPRVTLTEAKRKSWISDLANLEVPLRKLSKTIPQGIRGVSLLDQCLQHSIPLSRAIWFTKCVGANEIRTLKRKGVTQVVAQGAEAKWLREWTVNVQQFLEGNLAQCGQDNWKDRIRYCISLCARLYFENLLDRDQYLEWIIKSLSTASTNHWPFWLMIVHIHRLDLTAFRKRGKQLAESLVLKYNAAQNSPGEVLQPLAQSFAAVIRPLALAKPECFLMPDRWSDCQKALESCFDAENESHQRLLKRLRIVNERTTGKMACDSMAKPSAEEQIVESLDSAKSPFSLPLLHESLQHACQDTELLLTKCLEWGVSRFRTAQSRVYICARLFRKWQKQGFDTDATLLRFIFDQANAAVTDGSALKHLISELSRSQTFPLSKYMQWLSVRGLPYAHSFQVESIMNVTGLNREGINMQNSVGSLQVLTDVCVWNTEDHLTNLRQSILDRAGYDQGVEAAELEKLRMLLSETLMQSERTEFSSIWRRIDFHRIPWSVRTQLSYWLRGEVATLAKASQMDIPGKPPLPGIKALTLRRFHIVREILEKMQDIAILADVIRLVSTSRQEEILAAAVDVMSFHSSTLSAIGALEPLQTLYCQTYLALRSVKTTMPSYVNALIDLCRQYPIKYTPIRALQQDLVRGDRGRAVTACSPFSDGVAESLQQAGATFHDDFEAILQTESNMTEQTMLRLFSVLTKRIEKSQHESDGPQQYFVLCQLLVRLKLCQKAQGDLLIQKWITKLCNNSSQPMDFRLLMCLVCTRCTTLDAIMDMCQQLPTNAPARNKFYEWIRLGLVDHNEDNVDEALWYGYKLAISKLTSTRPVELLEIIGTDESGRSLGSVWKAALVVTIVSHPDMMKSLSKPAWIIISQALHEYLNGTNSSDAPENQVKSLASTANPLSLPFCSLRMRMLCQNAATKNDEKVQDDIALRLCGMIADTNSSLSASPRTLQALLRATGPVISGKIRINVEQAFYQALPKFLQSKSLSQPPNPTAEETEQTAAALRQVILVSADTAAPAQSTGATSLVEKLTIYMKMLSASSTTSASQNNTAQSPTSPIVPMSLPEPVLYSFIVAGIDHLNFLLRMLCVKRPMFSSSQSQPSPATAKTLQQEQIKLVGLVITIATHSIWPSVLASLTEEPQAKKINDAIEFAFEVAAVLVDDMTEESRVFSIKILKDKLRHERVRWLLGSVNTFGSVQSPEAGHGYQVVHENKGTMTEWKPKVWEILESGGSAESSLGLGLFGARKA